MTIRRAVSDDLSEVLRLATATPEAPQWSADTYRANLEGPPADPSAFRRWMLLAIRDGKVAGFAVASSTDDGSELESLVVDPARRREGIASALMHELMQQSDSAPWRLEVRAGNTPARALYAALGFVQCGARVAYYRNPVEDAVLMFKKSM